MTTPTMLFFVPDGGGAQILANGNMEIGSPPTGWTKEVGDITATPNSYEGLQALNLACGTGTSTCYQRVKLVPGTYRASVWARNNNGGFVRLRVYTDPTFTLLVDLGATTGNWTDFTGQFTLSGSQVGVYFYFQALSGTTGSFDVASLRAI